jgi:hypothetical protein
MRQHARVFLRSSIIASWINSSNNMRDDELYHRAALVWRTLHGTPAAMSLMNTMMAMDPLLDKVKAQKNKATPGCVAGLPRKLTWENSFQMARSNNNNNNNNAGVVPWRVATVWLAFIGTDVE